MLSTEEEILIPDIAVPPRFNLNVPEGIVEWN